MDLVIGIDSSTTATKAIAWDASGRAVADGRAPVPMASPRSGWFEQEPEDWWGSLTAALGELWGQVAPERVAALAISNQRETVGFIGPDGRSVAPAIVWLDERCREDVRLLADKLGHDRLLEITGKVPNTTASVYSLHWLQRTNPETLTRSASIVDVHGYLVHRLTGERRTSWGSSDPHGVLDLRRHELSQEVIAAVGARPEQFYAPLRPGSVLGHVTPAAAELTGLKAGTAVIAGGGDGQAAGLGTGTLGDSVAYLNLGTASVSGVFSADYRVGRAFRTLTSLSGEGYILEICLRTGTFLTEWIVGQLFGLDARADRDVYGRLEAEAAALPAGADGLLLMPYWLGVMTPHWDDFARGAMIGFGPGHGRAHVYRAMMEGIALDEAMGLDAIEAATGEAVRALVLIGGGARSALWRQIVADATGKPTTIIETVEASTLGAGMLAAAGAGWYATPAEAARAMCGRPATVIEPDAGRAQRYRELLVAYADLYPALQRTFQRLAAFTGDAD